MLLELPVGLFVVDHKHQQSLAACTLELVEVALKVVGQLHSGIVLKVCIQRSNDAVEGGFLLQLLEAPVLEESPGDSLEGSNYVQDRLVASLGEHHLAMVEMDSLTPFFVIGRLA